MRHILIADDTAPKLHAMRQIVEAANPNAVIHAVGSVREAIATICIHGNDIDTAVVDFDFEYERSTGETIVRALRNKNRSARIVCATARPEGEPFDDAKEFTAAAGADGALCYLRQDFAESLRGFVA